MKAKRSRIRLARIWPSILPLHTRWLWEDNSYLSLKISDHKDFLINSQVHTHLRGGWVPVKGTVASQKNLSNSIYIPVHSGISPPIPVTKGSEQLGSTMPTLKPSLKLIFLHSKSMWNWSTAGSNHIELNTGKQQEPSGNRYFILLK